MMSISQDIMFIYIMFMFIMFLYILNNSAFSEVSLANIFCPVCGLSFHSPDFRRTEVLNFNEALLINAFFHKLCL